MKGRGALRTRVLTAATVLMILFFAAAFGALDLAFRRAAESSLEEILQSQVMGLLAAADPVGRDSLGLPDALPEARFSRPGSGLYGQVIDSQGETIWTSASALGLRLPITLPEESGRIRYERAAMDDGTELLNAALRIEWEFEGGDSSSFVFVVGSDLRGLRAQISRYRAWLGGGFGALLLVLIGVQLLLLRYLMRPLGQAEAEISAVESGRMTKLSDGYPAEIQALSSSINRLIDSERSRTRRYRESLDNLAHSLKTPLSVIRSHLESGLGDPDAVDEQISRMRNIVDYQLRRAAASGASLAHEPVPVEPVVLDVLRAVRRAHGDKQVTVDTRLDPDAVFPGSKDDLMEILGNLLDNAFKFCRARVNIRVSAIPDASDDGPGMHIFVDDDGPGLGPEEGATLLARGIRGQHEKSGQGIGLAVVADIAETMGGTIHLGDSPLGGARVNVTIPRRHQTGRRA